MNELITTNNELAINAKQKIINLENTIKELQKQEKQLREQLLKEMEDKGIVKFDSDELLITKKESTYRETFNAKKFKAENEDLYNDYVSFSKVKPSLLIKVK